MGKFGEKKKQSENTIHTYASKVDLKIRTVIASAFLWPRKGSAEVVAWGGEVECSIKS